MVGGYAGGVAHVLRLDPAVGHRRELHGGFLGGGDLLFLARLRARRRGRRGRRPRRRACRRCGCAATTSRSSRSASARSCACSCQRTDDVLHPEATTLEHALGDASRNLGGALGFGGMPTYTRIFWVYVFVAIVLLARVPASRCSSKGRALLAVRENEIAAEAMGIDTARVKVAAFVMAAFFAGIGGALFAHELGTTLDPARARVPEVDRPRDHGRARRHGLDHRRRARGDRSSTILPELFREFADYRMIVYALALIVVMIVRPQGLFGIKELWEHVAVAALASGCARRCGAAADATRATAASRDAALATRTCRSRSAASRRSASSRCELPAGGLYGLIGPNGAGKTTVFNLLTGVYTPDTGDDPLGGERIDGQKPSADRARRHRAHVPEHPPVRRAHGARQRAHGRRRARDARAGRARSLRTPLYLAEERAIAERCARAARRPRHRAPRRRAGQEPAVRRSAPPRDRARARDRAEGAAARRAGRRA